MGFWIFMLIMNLLIPVTMIVFGNLFANNVQGEINRTFGYRTAMSMKNRDTWEFAHRHCGRLWRMIGWILLPVSAAAMAPVIGKDIDFVGFYGAAVCALQGTILIVSIFPTEIALKKNFDKFGHRKK